MKKFAFGLTGNQLKMIALVSMTIDHIGYMLYPDLLILRTLGRLAFPIFAYMIAEGCCYTRSMPRYFVTLALCGAVCQAVYLVSLRSLYMCIFVTFGMSVGLIWLAKLAQTKRSLWWYAAFFAAVLAAYFLAEVLPYLLPKHWDYGIDYGFIGIVLPVCVYLCKKEWQRLLACGILLVFLALCNPTISYLWYALLSLPLLALYNGKRGKWKLKWFFYIYYPAHLVALWAILLWQLR